MVANQRQIPVIQVQDNSSTQIQQNSNKVFRNLSNNVDSINTKISQMEILGEVKLASLTLSQFQDIAGKTWVLADGGTAVDTDYARLTGNKVVPNVTIAGVTAFIKVNTNA